jgi:hypothetical protein
MTTNIQSDGLVSLDVALTNQNSSGRPMKTFVGYNTGNRTFTILLSLWEVQELTEVANDPARTGDVAQRKLDIKHAGEIAKYILKGLISSVKRKKNKQGEQLTHSFLEIEKNMGTQPYLSIPPLVASFRNCMPNGTNLSVKPIANYDGETIAFKIFFNHGDIFWIVDGQHRRKAIQMVYEFLNYTTTHHKYPAKGSLYVDKSKTDLSNEELQVWFDCLESSKECTVSVEVHLGLGIQEERQLFHDLNNLAKKVEKSLALQFDLSNLINQFIKEVLIDDLFEMEGFNVSPKDKINWQEEGSALTRKDLASINAILFLNKTNINGATPILVESKMELAKSFWTEILKIKNILDVDSKQKTVAAQPVVLKALAKLFYDFNFGKNKDWVNSENADKLLNGFTKIDFSHSNPMWRYYQLPVDERVTNGLDSLKEYLPSDDEGFNRDLGNFDETFSVFRFGAKHNDIYPIIGDMIRWSLGLPKRTRESLPLLFNN